MKEPGKIQRKFCEGCLWARDLPPRVLTEVQTTVSATINKPVQTPRDLFVEIKQTISSLLSQWPIQDFLKGGESGCLAAKPSARFWGACLVGFRGKASQN